MNILIVNSNDISGGAARAAYRLNQSLQKIGVNSRMLVQDKSGDDQTVSGAETWQKKFISGLRPGLDRLPVRRYPNHLQIPFSPAWLPFSDIVAKIQEINPDLVHLHYIANGMLRLEDLARIHKPMVWSLHDMWAFTGGCHYDHNCGKYESECASCPNLNSSRKSDLSNRVFRRKMKTYGKIGSLTVVGLSGWIADCAKKSALLGHREIIHIPNPINTERFGPVDVKTSRSILGLPPDKKLILFGSDSVNDYLKGFQDLPQALERIRTDQAEIVVFGSGEPKSPRRFRIPSHYVGRLSDDISLRILYSAADVTVLPSLQENLSNVIMESLSCGTPVVAFALGGNGDMIEHRINGYLAEPSNAEDLAAGIDWVLKDERRQALRQKAREKVLQQFEMVKVAERYHALYQTILNRRG